MTHTEQMEFEKVRRDKNALLICIARISKHALITHDLELHIIIGNTLQDLETVPLMQTA
jgi:hypothetical protein